MQECRTTGRARENRRDWQPVWISPPQPPRERLCRAQQSLLGFLCELGSAIRRSTVLLDRIALGSTTMYYIRNARRPYYSLRRIQTDTKTAMRTAVDRVDRQYEAPAITLVQQAQQKQAQQRRSVQVRIIRKLRWYQTSAETTNKCQLRDGARTASEADGSVLQLQDAEIHGQEGSTCLHYVHAHAVQLQKPISDITAGAAAAAEQNSSGTYTAPEQQHQSSSTKTAAREQRQNSSS